MCWSSSSTGALNANTAQGGNAYQIAPILKTKGKPPRTKIGKPVALALAGYNATNNTVTLIPRSKLNLEKPEQLSVNAALVKDAFGRPIDGNDDGQPGGDYLASFSKRGASAATASLPHARKRP